METGPGAGGRERELFNGGSSSVSGRRVLELNSDWRWLHNVNALNATELHA